MRNKVALQDLALFGGEPAFPQPLHVGRPNLGDREALLQRINDILDRRWLTNNGTYVRDFERRVCELVGTKHCIACCNGAVALEITIRALELKGEVIVPGFTFIATAHALQWQEITPVLADIDPATHLLAPSAVERMITPRTTGILGVHLWGQACHVEALEEIAKRHKLRLLFDAAHAFGCGHKGRMIGNFGEAEVFSFHATKFVNCLEGGAVVTNNDELARKIRLMKNFGFLGYDHVGYIGTNGKMNEFCAAMGLTSLDSMESFIQINRRNYQQYCQELDSLPGIRVLKYNEEEHLNYQYVVAEINPATCPLSRDQVLDLLWSENVQARRYFYPGCHRMEPYQSYFPNAGLLLPHTENVSKRILILPTGQAVEAAAIGLICQIIRLGLSNTDVVAERLKSTTIPLHPKRPV